MNKKSKWLLATACLCIAMGAIAGCNNDNNSSGGESQTKIELDIASESVVLELFEEYALEYNYTGKETLSWSVEDPSIVSVVGGKLVALKEGETTVTVQVGNLSDVCTVKVNGVQLDMLNVSVDESSLSLYAGDSHTLLPTVVYGTKVLNDCTFSYESMDADVVSVSSSGVLTAKSVGNATVIVTASALGKSVGCLVNVTVNASGSIAINTLESELFVLAEYEGKQYKNETQLQATVKEKGVRKNDAVVVWSSSDEGVATVENGKVVAVGRGNAQITATYVDEGGSTVQAISFVTVVPVVHTRETQADIIRTQAFGLDGLQVVSDGAYLTDGTLKTTVPVSDGKLDFSEINLVGETTLVLDTGDVLIHTPVYIWTDVIIDAEGLTVLQTATTAHYRLGADLDFTDVAWTQAAENETVFKGVLDGGNYTIKNFAPTNGGLFYSLGNGAKVKNLHFENATISSTNSSTGLIASVVAADATVSVENITGTIFNHGNACGGLFGMIKANATVTLQDSKMHVYAENTATTGGALVGSADGNLVMPNDASSTIYANINLCGSAAVTGCDNSASETINKNAWIQPKAYANVVDVYEALDGGLAISISETSVVKATLFAKSVGEVAYDNGFILPAEQVQNFAGNNVVVMIEKINGTFAYYTISLKYGELKLTNDNKDLLKYAQGGTIVLQEDIDLGGETWTTAASFNGILDGNGYAIKNLTTAGNASAYYGLFVNIAGEVKNIAFVNVTLGKNSGVLAGRTSNHLAVSDVFIQVSKTSGGRASATVDYSQIAGVTVNLTDVVIVMPRNISNEFIYGNGVKGVSTLTNVHCVGISDGGYSYAGSNYVNLKNSTVAFHTDKVAFNLALQAENSEITLSVFNKKCVETYYGLKILKIAQSNASDLLTLNGDEYVYLTEDLDLAEITWNTTVTFTGTLEGNSHVIKNLTTCADADASGGGFFRVLSGRVQNVAFTNVTLAAGTAVLSFRGGESTSTVENVFIQVAKTNKSGSNRFGVICERQNNAASMNLANVVIKMPGTATNEAIYGYTLKGVSTLTNVHCIGLPNEAASVHNTAGTSYFKGAYTLHSTLGVFASAEKTLTEFLDSCVDTYLYADLVMITQENVETLLTLNGDEHILLLEDVDLAGITWDSEVSFTGTFDGVNHTISNLTTVSGSGFFQYLGGTVKNVAFTNVTLVAGTAVLCYQGGTTTTTVENVFIQVVKTNKSGSNRFGVICERQNNAAAMNLTNVVITMPGTATNEAIYGYTLKGQSVLTNVHCIGLPNETESVQNSGTYFSGTYTLHTDLDAFNAAEKTLTDFLSACVTTYLQ